MKNKRNTYLLLVIVLTIWGLVLHQFFSLTKNETNAEPHKVSYNFKVNKLKPIDTTPINVNYRDPFLGKIYAENVKKTVSNNKKNPSVALKKPVNLSLVIYKGIVSDSKEKTKVFMLIINGRTYLMKKGDTESDVVLKEGNRESVTVKNKGILQTIPIQV